MFSFEKAGTEANPIDDGDSIRPPFICARSQEELPVTQSNKDSCRLTSGVVLGDTCAVSTYLCARSLHKSLCDSKVEFLVYLK
jgi:hypothetical protein